MSDVTLQSYFTDPKAGADLLQALFPELRRGHALEAVAARHGTNWDTLSARPNLPAQQEPKATADMSAKLLEYGFDFAPFISPEAQAAGEVFSQPTLIRTPPHRALLHPLELTSTGRLAKFFLSPETLRQHLGFMLNVDLIVSFDAWYEGRLTKEALMDEYAPTDEFEDDNPGLADWQQLEGLAENIREWAPDLDHRLPGLTRWAQERRWQVDVDALLARIFEPGRTNEALTDMTLIHLTAMRRSGKGMELVSLHPERWVSAMWAIAVNDKDTEAHAWLQVARNYGLLPAEVV